MRGVSVYTNTSLSDIHTSGHGSEEELKLMIRLINPKYFMPYHGEYRMLKKHAKIAEDCDIPKNNTFVLKNGDVLIMKDEKVELSSDIKNVLNIDKNQDTQLQKDIEMLKTK